AVTSKALTLSVLAEWPNIGMILELGVAVGVADTSKTVLTLCGCVVLILFGCTAAQIEHNCGAAVPRPAQSVEVDGVSVNFEANLKSNRSPTIVLFTASELASKRGTTFIQSCRRNFRPS